MMAVSERRRISAKEKPHPKKTWQGMSSYVTSLFGMVLHVERVSYAEGVGISSSPIPAKPHRRSLLLVRISMVPANPEEWQHPPFTLQTRETVLWSGVTDCLGCRGVN
jgi:hypothetical protein